MNFKPITMRCAVWIFIISAVAHLPKTYGVETITTADIVSRSASIECLDWKIVGLCFWLRCTIFGCRVVTTPKISHRLPDFVVSAYQQTGEPPWLEIRAVLSATTEVSQDLLAGGHLSGISSGQRHGDSVKFYEVDVVGNPASKLKDFGRFLCKSDANAMHPYFMSLLDAIAWRSGGKDLLRQESFTPGMREIGKWPKSTWGSVFPRSGFILQTDPAKAAAVASQRSIDIVTSDGGGHVHQANPGRRQYDVARGDPNAKSEQDCGRSGGSWRQEGKDRPAQCLQQTWRQWLSAADEKKKNWQMLHPTPNRRCEAFGSEGDWSRDKISAAGKYVWNYWRRYKCCIKGGGAFLKSVEN